MSRTTIENASLSLIVGGQGYEFVNVSNITINDPRENTLSGSPQGGGVGVVYRTGTTSPITADFVVREVPSELMGVLMDAFVNQDRIDVLLYDQITGDNYEFTQAVSRTNPSNATFAEGEEQLNVPFNIATVPNHFAHKPALQASEQA